MITKKQLWQSIYEIIKYTNYDLAFIDEEETDIILKNEKEKKLIRLITENYSMQSISFLMEKMNDHLDELESKLHFKPVQIQLLLVNHQNDLSLEDGLFIVKSINRKSQLDKLDLSRIYNWMASRFTAKSENFYRSKVLNGNELDLAMIKIAPVTTLLIILNVIVFLIQLIAGKRDQLMIDQGGLSHFNFVHGDYYRIISSIFLHLDFSHLLFNMMSLFIFGKIIERIFGPWKLLIIYFTAGIMGNLVSLSFDTVSTSAGASGAISGLFGALIAYFIFSGRFNRRFILQSVAGIIVFLLLSNLFANVNNLAHFGGLFGGLLAAVAIYMKGINKNYFYATIAGGLITIILLLVNIFMQPEQHIYNLQAKEEMSKGNFTTAAKIIEAIDAHGYQNDETYVLEGLVKSENSSFAEGVAIWKKGLKQFPQSSLLNYQMALAARASGDYKEVDKYLKLAEKYGESPYFKQLEKEVEVFKKQ